MRQTENITPDSVDHLATLSRLALQEEEKRDMARKLTDILEHFSEIQKIKTHNVNAANDVTGLTNVARTDELERVRDILCTPEKLLKAAPETEKGHMKVPGVFE